MSGLIQRELIPKSIIYFEDPFGKVKYQSDEDLENEIGTIIDAVKNSPINTYTIITSREEVFKEFEYKSIAEKLIRFEKSLNIKTPSYNYEKRKEMLLKWAKAKGCEWLRDEVLTNLILNRLNDKTKLSSPLKIKDYAISTVVTTTKKELLDTMDERSQETARSFANEIKEMTYDKILLLMFPFISDGFSESFIKSNYEILVKDLNISEEEAWEFSAIFEHFKRDKLDLKNGNIRFSHPSYSEAIRYIIFDKRRRHGITRAGEILEKVILTVSKYNYYDYNVAIIRIIIDNFGKMSNAVKKLFFKLDADADLAWIIDSNFDKLPPNINELLLNVADDKEIALHIGSIVSNNFDRLPEEVRNKLLLKVVDNEEAAGDVAYTVAYNFYSLPKNIQNVLFKLADSKETSWYVANAVFDFFYNLSGDVRNKLLLKVADNEETASDVAKVVAENFEEFPKDVRNKLLLKVVENEEAASKVSNIVYNNFDEFPINVRDELLRRADKPFSW